jgi:hypothetical protein
MFADKAKAPTPNLTLADCRVSPEQPYRGSAFDHLGAAGHEKEYLGYREARTFAGYGISLLDSDRTPLPLYRDQDGTLWVAIEDGASFVAELHLQGWSRRGDRWAAALRVNDTQASTSPSEKVDEAFVIVTQPRHKGDNILTGITQPSGEVQQFVARSEEHPHHSPNGPARYGSVTCTFYSEWHPQRFMSPSLRGPVVSGYSVGSNREGVAQAQRETFTVSRDLNTKVEIRYAPQAEISRLGLEPVEPVKPTDGMDFQWQGLYMPRRAAHT